MLTDEQAARLARMVGSLDAVLLVEVGREAPPPLPGFECFAGLPRPDRSCRGAGKGQGMAAYVRSQWMQYCGVVKRSEYVLWLRFSVPDRGVFFLGCVYIPPISSEVEWRQSDGWVAAFESLHADFQTFQSHGPVFVFGDFNAHTGSADDTGWDSQQVLDSMGAVVTDNLLVQAFPPRCNSDTTKVCEYGRLLLDLCVRSNCVLLNGRAPGDAEGQPTRRAQRSQVASDVPSRGDCSDVSGVTQNAHAHDQIGVPVGVSQGDDGASCGKQRPSKKATAAKVGSVLDYGVVSKSAYDLVTCFEVKTKAFALGVSDHAPLMCVFDMPPPSIAPGLTKCATKAPPSSPTTAKFRCVRWNPDKREQYVNRLHTSECISKRACIISGVKDGTLSAHEACEQWSHIVMSAASTVFGVSSGGQARMHDGRVAKRWFKHCKPQWRALQEAIRSGSTHAHREARTAFNAAKRKAKRHCEKQWHARLLDDLRHNPRRFWTAYKGRKMACMLHDMSAVESHWRALYGSPGQHSLPECGDSVSALVASLASSQGHNSHSAAAAVLNEPFSVEEVESALRKMHNGRMPGPDGMRGELLKGAFVDIPLPEGKTKHVFTLSTDLCELLNAVFRCGQVPTGWCSAYLSTVFKRGNQLDLDCYRGIAVGSALGKLFSMLLEARLSTYCEQQGFRAWGQAGFRHHRRTSDHVFVLKHLVDKCRLQRQHLFVCFVDFRKAYDLVRRDLLMRCLADIGLHGSMLSSIVSMYWQAPMQPKLGGRLGQPFDSTRGVKQGDPLSPLLFGVFFDRIEKWLEQRLPACGVHIRDRLVRVMLYADDLALMAASAVDLQRLLNALHAFCMEYHMEVNISKTEIVVFGYKKYRGTARWWLRDAAGVPQLVPVSKQFKYLGVLFHETQGVKVATDALGSAGRRAMWAMLTQCKDRHISDRGLQVQLFNTLVSPILCYCSEVWGPTLLYGEAQHNKLVDRILNNDLSRVQTLFLRMVACCVRNSTPKQLLLREFGCHPIARVWLRGMLGFYNRVADMQGSELLKQAMLENVSLSTAGGGRSMEHMRKHLWFYRFRGILHILQEHTGVLSDVLAAVDRHSSIKCPTSVLSAFDAWFYQRWEGLPANPRDPSVTSDQIYYCTYDRWLAQTPMAELDMSQPYTWRPAVVQNTAGINKGHVSSLFRFRLGAHDLGVATGRWSGVDRSQRTCVRCESEQLDDEFHMVFECPFYQGIRAGFPSLFASSELAQPQPDGLHVSKFMNQDATLVAAFVHACWLLRCRSGLDSQHILSLPDIVHVLEAGVEYYSTMSESSSLSQEIWHDAVSDDGMFDPP